MADSASILSSKNSEKSKLTNSVSRTTSETLRLADPDKAISQPNSLSTSTPKKKTSFQITSVIVGCRSSNDGGDDSADDLDESHTEDISEVVDNSRVTDIENETPSYSEDTFSKDDVFFNASSSLVSAPVIPTSSQYGLAILASTENSESASNQTDNCENSGTTVEVTESVINLGVVSTKHDPEMRDMHPPAPRTERFKVVKIESTEPFKRGRWVCMDYLDHNIAQNQSATGKTDSDSTHQNTLATEYSGQESSSVNNVPTTGATAEEVVQSAVPASAPATVVASAPITEQISNNNTVNIQSTDSNQPVVSNMPISAPSTLPSSYTSVSPGQSLQNNMQMAPNAVVSSQQPQVTQQAQSLSQVHMQQIMANSNQHQSLQSQQMQQVLANANVMPMQQQQTQQPQQPQQTQQQPQQQQQPPPQQPPQPQQAQMQSQQPIQQPMMQQPMQQIPTMHQPQQQYQPQQQQSMAQQQTFQPMQQQQSMMPQQLPPQQSLQQQLQPVQQVHMQQSIPPNIQQMPMQQQQGQPVQQQQMMQQQMPQMPHQVSYTQQLTQSQPTIVSQPSAQQQVPAGMLPHQMHPQLQNFQQNQMLANMQPQPIMNIQSQPHLQPQYYPTSMPQTSTMPGGMLPTMSQGSSLPVSMQGPSVTLPPLQTYTSIAQQMQQLPSMPQTPPVQTSVQYSLPCSMAGQQPPSVQPMSQQLPNLMQQTPQSYASIGSPAQSYASSVVSSLQSSIVEPVSVLSSVGSVSEQPPLAIATDYMPAPTAALLESLAEVTASPDEQQPTSEDPESASGASAVAIDNKIEQAMDLVKSHLMYAVREEVEVLKEKIAELMERISQLESENNILRAGASPETLAQLPAPQPQQTNNPS
uniref:Putative transcriptional regulator n=1 Tax=Panstrongylus lignarius TaxID=156445 RepID=A0A224XI41_9HEMI